MTYLLQTAAFVRNIAGNTKSQGQCGFLLTCILVHFDIIVAVSNFHGT